MNEIADLLLLAIRRRLTSLGSYVTLVFQVFLIICTRPPKWSLISYQLYHVGVLSLPVVAITGFSTGMVLAAQSFFQLGDKGLVGVTGYAVAKAMFTEMGPILTAFMVTGRVGSAMCAELGSMKVSEQMDALRSMSSNPLRYLIAPRFIAGIFMLPILTIFSNLVGIFGAYLVSIFYFGMSPTNFLDPIAYHVIPFDFFSGLIKAFCFGFLIITVSCYKGLGTTGGAAGVGTATTSSVVVIYSSILISNFFLTVLLNSIMLGMF